MCYKHKGLLHIRINPNEQLQQSYVYLAQLVMVTVWTEMP